MGPRSGMVAAVLLGLLGCAGPAQQPSGGLGESRATAIEVCRPAGQRAYLEQLRCPDGSAPSYRRIGSFGARNEVPASLTGREALDRAVSYQRLAPGQVDHHIVDKYELSCGTQKHELWMDMYHCEQAAPTRAPRGFSFVAG